MAGSAEFRAKSAEVVDLTVQDCADRAGLVGDWGVTMDQIDDRQPVLGDHTAPIAEPALSVWAAVTLACELGLDCADSQLGVTSLRGD
jgi:hypothetical protein